MMYYMLDRSLEIVDGIEVFESMIWTEKFYDIGDFELYLPATDATVELYTKAAKNHYYLVRADEAISKDLESLSGMIIDKVETDTSIKEGNKLIVTGKQLKNLLYRRVSYDDRTLSGKIQNELRQLVTDNCITPKNSDRTMPLLTLGDPIDGLDDMIVNAAIKGNYISTIMTTVCKDKKIGWDIRIDFRNKKLVFTLVKGTDRTHNQPGELKTHNPYVTFSPGFDNLLKTAYAIDNDNYRNVAYVGSTYTEIDEDTGKSTTVDNTRVVMPYKLDRNPVGYDRFELYINGSGTSSSNVSNIGGISGVPTQQQINKAEQIKILETQGRTTLEKYTSQTSVSGEVIPDLTYKFGKDYFLGDLVEVQNEFGIMFDTRVISVTTSLSKSKNSEVPSFMIENYTGKEPEDDTSLKEEDMRIDEEGNYRVDENGYTRKIHKGLEFTERITEDGQSRSSIIGRREETRSCSRSEFYDDKKYSKYIIKEG